MSAPSQPLWGRSTVERLAPLLLLALSITLAAAACERRSASPHADPSQQPVDASPSALDSARSITTRPAKTPERELELALDAALRGCEPSGSPRLPTPRCDGAQLRELTQALGRARLASLPALLDLLEREERDDQRLAAFLLKTQAVMFFEDAAELDFTLSGEDKRVAPLDVSLAGRLLDRVERYAEQRDLELVALTIGAAVDAGTLAGLDQRVRALIERFEQAPDRQHEAIYQAGFKRLMKYGRMRFFEDAKAQLDHPVLRLQALAFDTPMMMTAWSDEESEAICDWAGALLGREVKAWNAGPTRLLMRCLEANTWRHIALDEAARRYQRGTLSSPMVSALCRLCAPEIHAIYPPGGRTVCERAEQFFYTVTLDEAGMMKDASDRATMTRCLLEQWADKQAYAHLERLAALPGQRHAPVAQAAQALIARTPRRASHGSR